MLQGTEAAERVWLADRALWAIGGRAIEVIEPDEGVIADVATEGA